jgi:hypothetical protein
MKKRSSHGKESRHWNIFQIAVQKIQVSLVPGKNIRYFTWRSLYMYDNISLNSPLSEECFRKISRENQNSHFCSIISSSQNIVSSTR